MAGVVMAALSACAPSPHMLHQVLSLFQRLKHIVDMDHERLWRQFLQEALYIGR